MLQFADFVSNGRGGEMWREGCISFGWRVIKEIMVIPIT
jgi:hypothetical protein